MSTGAVVGLARRAGGRAAVRRRARSRRPTPYAASTRPPDQLGALRRCARCATRGPWAWSLAYLAGFVLHAVAIWLLPLYLAQAAIAMSLPVTAVTRRCCCTSGSPPVHWCGDRRRHRWAWCCSRPAPARPARSWSTPVVRGRPVARRRGCSRGRGLARRPPRRRRCWARGRARVRRLRDRRARRRDAARARSSWPRRSRSPVYGVLAFWLYSLGLDRARVSSGPRR